MKSPSPAQRVLDKPLLKDIWEPHYYVSDDMSIRSPDFARCDLGGLNLPHLAHRAPSPPAPSKRTHAEKQVQPKKRSRVERRTKSGTGPSRTVNTRESRGRAALEQVVDRLRGAGHAFFTPIILKTLPSDRIYRLV
ncbi:uncharacterized protein FSUBG_12398 [Fusarium subglutinans]|uniref:Uncharacterized protein n=1 Tax=Gibberella subglutinans TaxID=42677 RepID=A0A8H5P2E3_GIBSU|nr:uncharacterized protein FSUBG_12398 [Fusarium subglutinans]KAF5585623.1 hypothetical protein FSUBG_12398 [Fusarium subglutinans]